MPTAEKEALVQEVTARLQGVKGMYLADFTGLTVEKVSQLRAKCRAAGVEYKVIKNTLLKRAIHAHDIKQLDEFLEGPTALAYSTVSEVEPARVLIEFAKVNEKPVVKAATCSRSTSAATRTFLICTARICSRPFLSGRSTST